MSSAFEQVRRALELHLNRMAFQQTPLPPPMFIALVAFNELKLLNHHTHFYMFYVAIFLFLVTTLNQFFHYSNVLSPGLGPLAPLNLLMGLIGSNHVWKLYLFCFSMGYYLSYNLPMIKAVFVIVCSFYICLQTYNRLVFRSVSDNVWYFCGFFLLGAMYAYNYLLQFAYSLSFNPAEAVFLLPAVAGLGLVIIRTRLKSVRGMAASEIKDPSILSKYVEMLKDSFEQVEKISCHMLMHKDQCRIPYCLCQSYTQETLLQMQSHETVILGYEMLNQVYVQALSGHSWSMQVRLNVVHQYVSFLIERRHNSKAIALLTHTHRKSMNFFNLCMDFDLREQLKASYDEEMYFDSSLEKMSHLESYDVEVGYVTKQIKEILQAKIQFWTELCKQNPMYKLLEPRGRQLVDRIQNLHEYFMKKVRPSEQILSNFKCTFIYSSYLMLTTNYLDFASSLTKKSQKVLDEKKTNVSSFEEYGIFLQVCENYERRDKQLFELMISNASSNLCAHLKQEKKNILFHNISVLIPKQYAEIHTNGFDQYFQDNKYDDRKSKVIGSNIKLPFKVSETEVLMYHLNASLKFDHIHNLMMVPCVLTKSNNDGISFIVDLNGAMVYMESDYMKELIQHSLLKSSLESMKQQWEEKGLIKDIQFKVEEAENLIVFDCSAIFPQQLKIYGRNPLICVSIRSEQFQSQRRKRVSMEASNRIKQLQTNRRNLQNDSQTSTSSRKQSIENVLSVLMEENSLKLQLPQTMTLILFGAVAIILYALTKNSFLMWDASVATTTPSYTVIGILKMKILLNSAISYRYDLETMKSSDESFLADMNSIYGIDIRLMGDKALLGLVHDQKKIIYEDFLGTDNEITDIFKLAMEKKIKINIPPSNETDLDSHAEEIPLYMSMRGIVFSFIVDCYNFYDGMNIYERSLISFVYRQSFYQEIQVILQSMADYIFRLAGKRTIDNTVLCVIAYVALALFVIPAWRLNVRNKKKHQKVYTLLASIDAKLVMTEINKLRRVEKEIFHIGGPVEVDSTQKLTSLYGIVDQQKYKEKQPSLKQQVQESPHAQDKIKVRKRAGQVIVEGSKSDPKKFFIEDWLVLFFLLAYFIIFGTFFQRKFAYVTIIKDQFNESFSLLADIQNHTLALLNAKIYMDDTNSSRGSGFMRQDLGSWIQNWIRTYNHSVDSNVISEEIAIQQCNQKYLLCNNQYSERILQGLIKRSIAHSHQLKKDYYAGNQTQLMLSALRKARVQLAFAQAMIYKLSITRFLRVAQSFKDIEIFLSLERNRRNAMTVAFVLVTLALYAYIVGYAIWLKKNYVKDLTLLSLFNKEMLFNNKNIESFVHKLSKASR